MALSDRVKKGMMIVFLVLLVLGFALPGFLNTNQKQQQPLQEPRICQTDTDCYVTCGEHPEQVLCSQNLCQKNDCRQLNPFPFSEKPIRFVLTIVVDGGDVDGEEISFLNKSNSKNFFVQFSGSAVQFYSPRLSLQQILEKVGMGYNGKCLTEQGKSYCADEKNTLQLWVNAKQSFLNEQHVPQEGDTVEIRYRRV